MIGGVDVVLWVRDDIPATDVIFRCVRHHWPKLVFQDAEEDSMPYSAQSSQWLPRPAGPEFFIYRDEEAARSWDAQGATPDNANTMLYVILGKRRQAKTGLKSLTLVCGDLTGDMRRIVDEIAASFRDSVEGLRYPAEAA
ncbi:MAG TPA: hypothetical protein VK395_29525 [Gemmataceae bacterium]|nr:hypothetical protein [Gemmataceae bacterium]